MVKFRLGYLGIAIVKFEFDDSSDVHHFRFPIRRDGILRKCALLSQIISDLKMERVKGIETLTLLHLRA